jgi:hypothetical protein
LAIPHKDTLHADQAFNNAAEKHMLETIKRAVPLDERRFKLVCPSNADGVDAVHVLSKDLLTETALGTVLPMHIFILRLWLHATPAFI